MSKYVLILWLCEKIRSVRDVKYIPCTFTCRTLSNSGLRLDQSREMFFLIFGEHQSLLWGHGYPCLVTSTLGFKARVDSLLVYFLTCIQWISHIHLWCNTCWSLHDQYGNLFDPHTCTYKTHWWESNLGFYVCSLTAGAMPARLSQGNVLLESSRGKKKVWRSNCFLLSLIEKSIFIWPLPTILPYWMTINGWHFILASIPV